MSDAEVLLPASAGYTQARIREALGDMKVVIPEGVAARINRLILAVFIDFVWLISLGSRVVKRGDRHYVDVKSRRDKSYFRIGLDWVERCFRLDKPIPIIFSFYL